MQTKFTQLRPLSARYWPALVAAVVLLVVTVQVIAHSISLNDGKFIYGLDDAYIHMSIARNFVQHGVWGTTAYGYTSASSSPLWTALIALSYVFTGVNEIAPLLMNILLGVGLMFAIHHLLRRHDVPPVYSLVVLLAVIILIPLNTLILSGMEHVLQILLNVLFVGFAAQMLAGNEMPPLRSWESGRLLLLGTLVSTARYEGLFLVLIFCVLFALRLRLIYAVLLGAVSILPVILYGLVAIANGWELLPTSLLVKSDANYLRNAPFGALLTYFIADTYHIFANQHIMSNLLLTALAVYLFRYEKRRTVWDTALVMLVAFVLITFVNVRLVSWPLPGTFSRYEAYLIVLALVVIPAALGAYLPRRVTLKAAPAYIMAAVLTLFVIYDIYGRYQFIAFNNPIVTATTDIYRQQYQMARFLAEYYEGEVVAANDIGAINFFANIDNVDLWGLGTIEVARAKSQHQYTTDTIRQIMQERGGKIAVIYSSWFESFGGVPAEWVLVGTWQLAEPPAIVGGDTVSFYAVDPAEADRLAAHLHEFTPHLPDKVIVGEIHTVSAR